MNSKILPRQQADRLWDELFTCIKSSSFQNRFVFDAFRDFISPPPPLNGVSRICQNFRNIIPNLNAINKCQTIQRPWGRLLPVWDQLCAAIIANTEQINRKIPGLTDLTGTIPPYRGYYQSHCLGVALWCRPSRATTESKFHLLQAILCITAEAIRCRSIHENIALHDQLSAACLVVRKLAVSDEENNLVQLPDKSCSLIEYQAHLSNLIKNTAVNLSEHPLYPLHHLIDLALSKTDPIQRMKGIRRHRQAIEHTVTDAIVWGGNDDAPSTVVHRTSTITGDPQTELLRSKALLTPHEFSHSTEALTIVHDGADPSGGLSAYQQKLMVREALNSISMRNQMLPFAMERLGAHDTALLLRELQELSARSDSINEVPCRELAAFLAIGLWTSRSIHDIADTTISPALSDVKANLALYIDNSHSVSFVITPAIPHLKTQHELSAERQALTLARQFCLPVPQEAWRCIAPWAEHFLIKYTEQRIFNLPHGRYQAAADTFLKKLRASHDCRLNTDRVLLHLHNQLSQLDGSDITLAMAISGRNDILGKVPLHYTAHHINRILQVYRQAVEEMIRHGNSGIQTITNEIYTGSRFVPKRDVIKTTISKMRNRLAELRTSETGPMINRLTTFHNVYTSYTVLLVGFSTGYRAVHDPLLQDAEIDDESGFAVISDKVSADFYQARLVWLPPMCREQLKKYAEHQSRMNHALFTWNQELFFRSRECGFTEKGSKRKNPGLFYLDTQHNAVEVRPRSLDRYLRHIQFKLPVNANRHYLRTHLRVMGCPLEVLNAFMGHWEMGLEPWGRYAGLSPDTYRRELARYLPDLIKEDGWDVEPGF